MHYLNSRVGLAAVAVAGLAIAGPLALAHGDASKKKPDYVSSAESNAGFQPPAPLVGVIGFGGTEAQSETSKGSTGSTASASGPSVLGFGGDGAECDSSDAATQSASSAALDQGVPGVATVRVLSASCEADEHKSNNASSSAQSSVVEASVLEVDASVLSTSSETRTTSGSARSEGSFALLQVEDTVVGGCTSSATANNGHPSESDELDGGVVVGGVELPIGVCSGTSTSTHERTPPPDPNP